MLKSRGRHFPLDPTPDGHGVSTKLRPCLYSDSDNPIRQRSHEDRTEEQDLVNHAAKQLQ